jgi:signal transduction histidine kinase
MDESAEIVLVYFVGTFGMALLAGAIILFFTTYQKRLLKKELEINRIKSRQQEEILQNTVLSQEKERKRIAQDLHDEVGAMLSVVKLNIAMVERKSDTSASKEIARETRSYLDEVILQVRRISRALLPPSLDKLGLAAAVEELVNWVNKSDQVEVVVWKTEDFYRFDGKKEMAIFRIIQELLNNALKHAQATQIVIKIRFCSSGLAVSVCDNGVGFDINSKGNSGLGLKNLESRTQILNARIKLRSAPGKGTSAILFLNSLN